MAKMTSLKIVKEGNTIGVLPMYNKESTLAELRLEIEDDFEVKDFAFEREATELDVCEEISTIVASTGLQTVDKATGNNFFVVTIVERSKDVEIESEEKPLKEKTKQNASCSNTPSSFLRSPKAWEIRGVKIYTQNEIETAKGMEKKRREFWNQTAKKLCNETKKSKCNVVKAIEIAWREHQATLLLEENNLLSRIQEDVGRNIAVPNQRKCKPGTIQKNANRIRQNKIELDKVNDKIVGTECSSGIGKKRKLNELQDRKKYLLAEMKKAQDVMRKNLKVSMGTVKDLTI